MARILHLIASNHRRGAETFAVELAEHLRSVGHDVRVMAVSDSGTSEPLPVEVAGKSRLDATGSRRIVSGAAWSEVVVSFGSSSLLVGAAAARLMRKPFVYRNIGDPAVWGDARFSNARIGAPVRTARRVVALYPGAADTLRNSYHLDPGRITIIPRGVPQERFAPADDDDRGVAMRRLNLDPECRWIAYVGALSPEKDPLLALEAVRSLPDDVGLVVAGGGPLEDVVHSAADELGPRVRMLGVVDDVRDVYAASSALVLPSKTEGIPGAAVEAGLCGLPVVAFDVGGVSSVVLDGRTGRLATRRDGEAVAESILDVLDRCGTYGPAARSHCIEHFSMGTVGRAWERVIEQVTTPGGPAPRARVLQVTSTNTRRGAEVSAHNLAESLNRAGYDVTTAALDPSPYQNGLPFLMLGPGRFRVATLVRLVRAMRSHDMTIVHGGTGLWPTLIGSTLARRPYLYRGIGEPTYWGDIPFGRVRIGWPIRNAAAVVALYRRAAASLISMYAVDPEKVSVVANIVPAAAFPAVDERRRSDARALYGVADSDIVVGCFGALSPEKRPEWAVELAAALDDITVLIAGTGPMFDELVELADRKTHGRARVVGAIDDPAVLMAALDLLILPSRTEGMPASVIESSLVGIPVVATDVGGVADVVEQLGAGVVTGRDDLEVFVATVKQVLFDDDLPKPDRLAAIASHDSERIASSWGAVIDGVASSGSRSNSRSRRRSHAFARSNGRE